MSEKIKYDKLEAYARSVEEVAEKIKKYFRDEDYSKEDIVKELGDVLFYVTALANHIGSDLQTVMNTNISKLQDRLNRNKIQGSGDNR